MIRTYDLELNTGSKAKLTFDFNFLVIASRIMEDKEKYPLSMDDALIESAKIVDDGLKFSELNRLVTLMFPFVFGAMQSTIDASGSERELQDSEVKAVLRGMKEPASLGYILGYTYESIAPKGLPEEKGKKKVAPVKKASR